MEDKSPTKFPWVKAFRLLVFLITFLAIGYLVYQSADQLRTSEIDFGNIGYQWWALAVVSYGIAMLLSNAFWYRVLRALGQHPRVIDCIAAFFASQLGKYIPGKAMVVVIRTDMIRGDKVQLKPAIASVFVETLTWIFVGSVIASLLLVFRFQQYRVLQVVAALLMLVAGVLTWPPIFRKIAAKLSSLGNPKKAAKVFAGLNFSTMSFGWAVMGLGWCFNGLSLWLVLQGLPGTEVAAVHYELALACVSLATVAGFVSLLPGGVGVRELVMIPLLSPVVGSANAIIAAVIIRLVWLTAELTTAGIIFGWKRMASVEP